MSVRSHLRKLAMERLEDRWLLAGDCAASFDGETLEIKCDHEANQLEVFERGGDVIVWGVDVPGDETTINGANVVNGTNMGSAENLTDVFINTRGGSDVLGVSSLSVADSVNIRTGRGSDQLFVSLLEVGEDLDIRTNRGADTVFLIDLQIGDSLELDTGRGRDMAFVNGIAAGEDIEIDMGRGRDYLEVGGLSAEDDIELDGGRGRDKLNLLDDTDGIDWENFEEVCFGEEEPG